MTHHMAFMTHRVDCTVSRDKDTSFLVTAVGETSDSKIVGKILKLIT